MTLHECMKVRVPRRAHIAAVFAALAAFALPSQAYAGFHDMSQAFDVGDYEQSGLLLHFDGIRNSGADAEHNAYATTWVNLGAGYGGEKFHAKLRVSNTSDYVAEGDLSAHPETYGAWQSDGYLFVEAGKYDFMPDLQSFRFGTNATLQALVDATATNQTTRGPSYPDTNESGYAKGFVFYSRGQAAGGFLPSHCFSIGISPNYASDGTTRLQYGRCEFSAYTNALSTLNIGQTNDFTYATAIKNCATTMIFRSTEIPVLESGTSAKVNGEYGIQVIDGEMADAVHEGTGGFGIGGFGSDQYLEGVIKTIRYYDRVLSNDELKWNRKVDDNRFFGVPVPTNVVIASQLASLGLGGFEPDGAYAVDARGHAFSAQRRVTLADGRRYTMTGYTIETWDDENSRWGDPVRHDGSSVTVSQDDALFRLTWLWMPERAWCEPSDFEPVDYADQDHLQLHYDGIRNAGADAPHSDSATTWVNLGTLGSDLNLTRSTSGSDEDAKGEWKTDGYRFGGKVMFNTDLSPARSWLSTFSAQALVDAKYSDNTHSSGNYIAATTWDQFGMQIFGYNSNHMGGFNAQGDSRVVYFETETGVDYITATHDASTMTVTTFDGTVLPTSGNGYKQYEIFNGLGNNNFRLGGWGGGAGSGQCLVGTIKNFRYYDRILTDDELSWNRVVDQARFFGEMPVGTNAVVCSLPEYVKGDRNGYMTPTGQVYKVNEAGYTFTAPGVVTNMIYASDGTTATATNRYRCAGYILERWDETGGEWGSPETNRNSTSCYVAANDRVRITWLWRSAKAIAMLDVDAYVQGGLLLDYDGICNNGPGTAHDDSAITWVNSANPGTYDMTRYSLSSSWASGASEGSWTDTGFAFDKKSVFHTRKSLTIPSSFTMQVLMDAKTSGQNGIGYIMCGENATKWQFCSIALRSSDTIANTFYFNTMVAAAAKRPAISGGTYTYGTAILDGNDAVLFAGTEAPWSAAATGGTMGHYVSNEYVAAEYPLPNGFSLGGHYPRSDELFKGTLKFYRFYNRVLSDNEVAWNRIVDNLRFFGETNAEVYASTSPGGEAALVGMYVAEQAGGTLEAPSGSYTDGFGNSYHVRGFNLQVWDGSDWSEPVYHGGTSVQIDPGEKVRVTWLWRADGWRDAADYDVGDYAQDGLVLHLDGIRNAGADLPHDGTALAWRNLATEGSAAGGSASFMNLADGTFLFLGVGDDGSAWTDKGYYFGGYTYAFMDRGLALARDVTVQAVTDTSIDGLHDRFARTMGSGYACVWPSMVGTTNAPARVKLYYTASTNEFEEFGDYDSLRFNASGQAVGGFVRGWTGRYATAMLDSSRRRAALFHTAVPPAWTSESVSTDIGSPCVTIGSSFASLQSVEEWGSKAGDPVVSRWVNNCFSGTVHSVRIYSRALSDDELLSNRQVDDARFFGIAPTNVLVRSELPFVSGCESGAYAIGGAGHVFGATNRVANGMLYKPTGCVVETLDAATGEYGNPEFRQGDSVSVGEGENIRITWQWQVSCVEDGLVLHYDGIRNVGAEEPHSTTTNIWHNLAAGYEAMVMDWCSYVETNSATHARRAMRGDSRSGAWNDTCGFDFDGEECFIKWNGSGANFVLPVDYTFQYAVTASVADQTGNGEMSYLFLSGSGWDQGATAMRYTENASASTPANAVFSIDKTRFGVNTTRPYFVNENPRYINVMGDGSALRCFEGGVIPSSGDGYKAGTLSSSRSSTWFAVGGQYDPNSGKTLPYFQGFHGTLHSLRFYNRTLAEDELAWNRKVDDVRFFGGANTPDGTGTLIVRSTAEGLEGREPSGAYSFDECAGYAFSSPVGTKTIDGMDYRFDGYVLETWNGSGWGGAVTNYASCYSPDFAASAPDRRLTWLWTLVRGLRTSGGGLSDYVQEGLVLHLDGLKNTGAASPHGDAAGFWANLAAAGGRATITDMTASLGDHAYAVKREDAGRAWLRNGYFFGGYSYATMDRATDMPGDLTVQVVCDTDPRDMQWRKRRQIRAGASDAWTTFWANLVGTTTTTPSDDGAWLDLFYTVSTDPAEADYDSLRFKVGGANLSGQGITGLAGWGGRYATAVMDFANQKASLFETAAPGAWYSTAFGAVGSPTAMVASCSGSRVSAAVNYTRHAFYGTIYSVRIYTNALSSAQLEQNRRVDDLRFHRTANVTNVLIEASNDAVLESAGAYEVAGSWTFTADTVAKWNGARYKVTGYDLQAWNGSGWGEAEWHEGESSYTYVEGVSPAKVKVTWTWNGNSIFIMYQ